MVFNSLEFFPFFIAAILAYFLCPHWQWKKVILIGASFFFYG